MRIFLAAGGSGGHIIPALAVAEVLQARGIEVTFLGVGKELERKLIAGNGYPLEEISFPAISGKGLLGILRALWHFPGSLLKCRRIFLRDEPAALLAFGGYPSFIPVITATLLRVPRALHEQNMKVGLANKLLASFCNRVYAVPGVHGFFAHTQRTHTPVSNPVRSIFYQCPEWASPAKGEPFNILVLGGSQGAKSVNDAVMANADLLQELGVKLVHQTGQTDWERVHDFYTVGSYKFAAAYPFIDTVVDRFREAHLVISRAGAISVSELVASGKPAIFIPLAIARAHQSDNIQHVLANKAGLMLEQTDQLGANLGKLLRELIPDKERLNAIAASARTLSKQGDQTSAEYLGDEMIRLAKNPSQADTRRA